MPKKYHIPIKTTAPRFHPVGKYTTIEFREDCAGSCRKCVKKKCVYGIFKENYLHMSTMQEPEYLYACQSCFRCVQECTKGIFSRVINPEYRTLGDAYWRADIIHRQWYQAHTGKVPVSGAGYRGPFVAEGFDSIWTDMSEIVRPTRDGIHGREYINTCFELSRRISPLKFNADMTLASKVPPILELPIPLLLDVPADLAATASLRLAAVKAAKALATMMLIDADGYTEDLAPYSPHLIPRLSPQRVDAHRPLIEGSRAVELTDEPGIETVISQLRQSQPDLVVLVGVPLDARAPERALQLAQMEVDTVHFYGGFDGKEVEAHNPRYLKDAIRAVHLNLVEHGLRQKINLVFSGGIALAEHLAKAIICGADGVGADYILYLALECRLCKRCQSTKECPVKLDEPIDPDWGGQRIVNLLGAWQSQLLEVMGAMGIREARRLRGEVGRSMWFEDLERENFGPIFGERKVSGLG